MSRPAKLKRAQPAIASAIAAVAPPPQTLPFGIRRRLLPDSLESLAFSFLNASDNASLFLCSKALSARIARYLATTKTLSLDDLSDFPLKLAAQHCKRLECIKLNADYYDDDDHYEPVMQVISTLIKRNKNTLEQCSNTNRLSSICYAWLTQCPRLTTLELAGWVDGLSISRVSAVSMPGLRDLRLRALLTWQYPKILSQGALRFCAIVIVLQAAVSQRSHLTASRQCVCGTWQLQIFGSLDR